MKAKEDLENRLERIKKDVAHVDHLFLQGQGKMARDILVRLNARYDLDWLISQVEKINQIEVLLKKANEAYTQHEDFKVNWNICQALALIEK